MDPHVSITPAVPGDGRLLENSVILRRVCQTPREQSVGRWSPANRSRHAVLTRPCNALADIGQNPGTAELGLRGWDISAGGWLPSDSPVRLERIFPGQRIETCWGNPPPSLRFAVKGLVDGTFVELGGIEPPSISR
jgi:hypothetical protein